MGQLVRENVIDMERPEQADHVVDELRRHPPGCGTVEVLEQRRPPVDLRSRQRAAGDPGLDGGQLVGGRR